MDISLIFCLAKNIKINFPALMISHLCYCISHYTKVWICQPYFCHPQEKSNQIKLPSITSFDLEPDNYLTKDTLSRLSLKVLGGKLVFEGIETKGKGEVGSKRKLKEEVSTKNPRFFRKSQRTAKTKTPSGTGTGCNSHKFGGGSSSFRISSI